MTSEECRRDVLVSVRDIQGGLTDREGLDYKGGWSRTESSIAEVRDCGPLGALLLTTILGYWLHLSRTVVSLLTKHD